MGTFWEELPAILSSPQMVTLYGSLGMIGGAAFIVILLATRKI